MKKGMLREITSEGYEVVYISKYFFEVLENNLKSLARIPNGSYLDMAPMGSLRDEPAKIEFRRFESMVGWTSWYCPVKHCDYILYNDAMGSIKRKAEHLRTHDLKEL